MRVRITYTCVCVYVSNKAKTAPGAMALNTALVAGRIGRLSEKGEKKKKKREEFHKAVKGGQYRARVSPFLT